MKTMVLLVVLVLYATDENHGPTSGPGCGPTSGPLLLSPTDVLPRLPLARRHGGSANPEGEIEEGSCGTTHHSPGEG